MVVDHNRISAGSEISKRNPNPDLETKFQVKKHKSVEDRRLRAKHRGTLDTPKGLRRQVKDGELTPSEALRKLTDAHSSPAFVTWVSNRKPIKKRKQKKSAL